MDKKPGQHQPKRIQDAKILIANTPMDTDKIKVFGSRVRVDSMAKIAELEVAEKEKMKDKVEKIIKHQCNVFINRYNLDIFIYYITNVICNCMSEECMSEQQSKLTIRITYVT